MRINSVKKALAEGKLQLGTGFGQLRSQDVARILADAGFQWAFIDTEHGGFDLETVQDICRISVLVGLCPIVRVAELQYSLVTRALDAGAQGIIFPRVESPELLEKAISWTKFPPLGIRGYGLTPTQTEFEPLNVPFVLHLHRLIYAHSDCQLAKTHSIDGIPMFTAGRLNGAIKTGLHVDGNGEPGTRLGYTLQRLMGLPITSWGQGSMQTSREITEIIA